MGNKESTTYNEDKKTLEKNVDEDGEINYPHDECWEGHGGSHCSRTDIMDGTHHMNNLDDDSGNAILSQLVDPDGAYHAAAENIVGDCPDPSAHAD